MPRMYLFRSIRVTGFTEEEVGLGATTIQHTETTYYDRNSAKKHEIILSYKQIFLQSRAIGVGLAWAIFGAPVCAGFIAAMVGLVSKLSGHTFLGAFLPVLCVLAPLASIFCFYAFGEDAGAKYHMKKMVEKERGTLCEWEIVEEDHWEAFVEKLQSG